MLFIAIKRAIGHNSNIWPHFECESSNMFHQTLVAYFK